jgi:hypothetical protein
MTLFVDILFINFLMGLLGLNKNKSILCGKIRFLSYELVNGSPRKEKKNDVF